MEQHNWAYSFGDRKNFFFKTPVSKDHMMSFSHFSLFNFTSGIVLKKALDGGKHSMPLLFSVYVEPPFHFSIDSLLRLFGQTAEWEQTHG